MSSALREPRRRTGVFSGSGLEKRIERNITPSELADALARPDQTYLQGIRQAQALGRI